jgi:hypothetical protein
MRRRSRNIPGMMVSKNLLQGILPSLLPVDWQDAVTIGGFGGTPCIVIVTISCTGILRLRAYQPHALNTYRRSAQDDKLWAAFAATSFL